MAERHDMIERILRVAFPTPENDPDVRALAQRLAGANPFILPFYVSHFDSLAALVDPRSGVCVTTGGVSHTPRTARCKWMRCPRSTARVCNAGSIPRRVFSRAAPGDGFEAFCRRAEERIVGIDNGVGAPGIFGLCRPRRVRRNGAPGTVQQHPHFGHHPSAAPGGRGNDRNPFLPRLWTHHKT